MSYKSSSECDFDVLGYEEVKKRFDRGDFIDASEVNAVKKWLRQEEKERNFYLACQRASISSALDASHAARRANLIAWIALFFSAIAASQQIEILISALFSMF